MLLEVKSLHKSYLSGGHGAERKILDQLQLSVDAGESVAIIGPSGSGKTTLLNMIGAMDLPDGGEILIDGVTVSGMNERELAAFRNLTIGFVFQMHHLLPQLNLLENVLLPTLAGNPAPDVEDRARKLIERTGLSRLVHQKPGEMSGGECQRTAVARALINRPKLLLADEPTGALDRENADGLADLLVSMSREENTALIAVTHSMALAEKMDRIYRLEAGRLVLV